jgi:hypothetical protein
VPLVVLLPLQPPEAVQVVAFVLDQLSVELLPAVMLEGLAERLTVGLPEAVTVTRVLAGTDPPVPEQVSV